MEEKQLYLSGVMNVEGFSAKSTNDVASCSFVTCAPASSACYHLPASNSVSPYRSKLATRPESCTGDPPQATPPGEEAEQGNTLTNHPQKLLSVCECLRIGTKTKQRVELTITYATLSAKAATVRLRIIFCNGEERDKGAQTKHRPIHLCSLKGRKVNLVVMHV